MRLTNYNTVKIIPGFYYFALVAILLIVFLNAQFDNTLFADTKYYRGVLGIIFLLMIYVYFGGKYFDYDSDGNLISISNRGILLSNFLNYRTRQIDIQKHKVYDYAIYDFLIYKRLIIYTKSKRGMAKYRANITFVSPRKIDFIKQSLKKVIQENKQS